MSKYIIIKNYKVRINTSNISSYFPIDLIPKEKGKVEEDYPPKDWWSNPQPNQNKDSNIKEVQHYIGFCFNGDKDYVKKFIFKDREERDYCLKELDESIEMDCINVCAEYDSIKRGSKVIIDLWGDNFWKTVKYKNEQCITYKGKKISIELLQSNSWTPLDVISDEDSKGFLAVKNKSGEVFEIHKNLLKLFDI